MGHRPPLALGAGGIGGWALGELARWVFHPEPVALAPLVPFADADTWGCHCPTVGWLEVSVFFAGELSRHQQVLAICVIAILLALGSRGRGRSFTLSFGGRQFGPPPPPGRGSKRVAAYLR